MLIVNSLCPELTSQQVWGKGGNSVWYRSRELL